MSDRDVAATDPLTVPGYRLGTVLGGGATGTVYEARRLADGGAVAIKLLHPHVADQGHRERLRREARLMSAVTHPGVVAVHEVGGAGDDAWLVLDRLTGPDLRRLLEIEGPMTPERAASLLAEVADAVDSVHQAGVIHGDLKPANIILDDGRPLVGDFGVARQLMDPQPGARMDLTGGSAWIRTGDPSLACDPLSSDVGTVAYMPPEQWRGDGISAATDVYALGGTLFTLLTGRLPFERQTLPELAYAVAIVPAPRPSAFAAPRAFDDVVGVAMAKDPRDRFPTAAAFADAVRAAARGAGFAPRRRARKRWPVITAAAALACLGLGAALLLVPSRSAVPDTLVVCAVDASVRDAPHGRTLAVLHRGDHVSSLDARDGDPWVHVKLPDGRTGWSLTDYVRHSC